MNFDLKINLCSTNGQTSTNFFSLLSPRTHNTHWSYVILIINIEFYQERSSFKTLQCGVNKQNIYGMCLRQCKVGGKGATMAWSVNVLLLLVYFEVFCLGFLSARQNVNAIILHTFAGLIQTNFNI